MSKGHILVPVERVKELEAGGVTPYAASQDIAIPLLVDNWNLENDVYKQTVTVRGLDEDSSPIIVLSPVNDVATKEELKAYNCLTNDVIVTDGAITFTAKALPEMSFTVIAKAAAADGEAIGAITELVTKVETIEDTVETNTNAINSNATSIETNANAISQLNSGLEWKRKFYVLDGSSSNQEIDMSDVEWNELDIVGQYILNNTVRRMTIHVNKNMLATDMIEYSTGCYTEEFAARFSVLILPEKIIRLNNFYVNKVDYSKNGTLIVCYR